MLLRRDAAEGPCGPAARTLGYGALAATCASLALIIAVGIEGRSAAVPKLGAAGGWPPYFLNGEIAPAWTSLQIWAAVLLGGAGLTTGLIAVRRGWRPRPRLLVIGAAVAVAALWNALAFLAVALALDWMVRRDAASQARAHL